MANNMPRVGNEDNGSATPSCTRTQTAIKVHGREGMAEGLRRQREGALPWPNTGQCEHPKE